MENGFYSDYYQRVFSVPELQNALANYLQWSIEHLMEPELSSTRIEEWYQEGGDDLIGVVLYHSEMQQERFMNKRMNYTNDVVIKEADLPKDLF